MKLVDSKQSSLNRNNAVNDSSPLSSSTYTGKIALRNTFKIVRTIYVFDKKYFHLFTDHELSMQQQSDSDTKTIASPKLTNHMHRSQQQLDFIYQTRSIASTHNGTQTDLEVRCEETQTDRIPGPGFILAEHQDYLRRYTMNEVRLSNLQRIPTKSIALT